MRSLTQFLALPALCVFLTGCAFEVKPSKNQIFTLGQGSQERRLPQKVALVLSDDFVNYSTEYAPPARQHYDFRLGSALETYARAAADSAFASVEVVRGDKLPDTANVDLILKPTVTRTGISFSRWKFQQQTLALDVEWSAKRKGRETFIWMETISGSGRGRSVTSEIIDTAMQDLWQKTIVAFKRLGTLYTLGK